MMFVASLTGIFGMSLTEIGTKLAPYMPWLFLAALLIAVPLVYLTWRALHEDDEPAASEADLFLALKEARDKMTDAEFRRLRERLIGAKPGERPARAIRPADAEPPPVPAPAPPDQPAPADPADPA
jgi:hypothetical protein